MASPVIGKNVGSGIDQLKAQIIGWVRDEIRASQRGGIGLHVDGATGDLVADRGQFRSGNYAAGTAGWALKPNGDNEFAGNTTIDGNTTIGGNAAITGTLSLPAGIINNAALASPVVPQAVYFTDSNFALVVASSTVASSTITVPTGFTTAVVSVTARVFAYNNNTGGGTDYFYAKPTISGFTGTAMPVLVLGGNSSGVNVASFSKVLTGLSGGGTFTITALASTVYSTWPASTGNAAEVSGTILWFR